jgi:hypothetical protein
MRLKPFIYLLKAEFISFSGKIYHLSICNHFDLSLFFRWIFSVTIELPPPDSLLLPYILLLVAITIFLLFFFLLYFIFFFKEKHANLANYHVFHAA